MLIHDITAGTHVRIKIECEPRESWVNICAVGNGYVLKDGRGMCATRRRRAGLGVMKFKLRLKFWSSKLPRRSLARAFCSKHAHFALHGSRAGCGVPCGDPPTRRTRGGRICVTALVFTDGKNARWRPHRGVLRQRTGLRDASDVASALVRSFSALASRTPAVRSSALSASALAPSGIAAFTDGAARTAGNLRGTVEGTLRSSTLLKSPPAETRGGVTAYVIFRRDLRAGGASLSASAIKKKWKKVSVKQKTVFKASAASEVKKKRVGDCAARAALAATTPATSAQGTAEASVQHSTFVGGATATVTRDAAAATPNAGTALLGFGRALRPRA